jgi:hypothetical protein
MNIPQNLWVVVDRMDVLRVDVGLYLPSPPMGTATATIDRHPRWGGSEGTAPHPLALSQSPRPSYAARPTNLGVCLPSPNLSAHCQTQRATNPSTPG